MRARSLSTVVLPLFLLSCQASQNPPAAPPTAPPPSAVAAPAAAAHAGTDRTAFNRAAVRLNLPLFWANDADGDGSVDPNEVSALLFYPTEGHWVENGAFTKSFEEAWTRVLHEVTAQAPTDTRRQLVVKDLDQGRATLVRTDLGSISPEEKTFVRHMLNAATRIDDLYATQIGARAIASQVAADDPASQSLFRRNWGPKCAAPLTEKDPQCSAIAGSPKLLCDAYPAALQSDAHFCEKLEKLPNAKDLLAPFGVVRANAEGKLGSVGLSQAYEAPMAAIAQELRAAASDIANPGEAALKEYLAAAAKSFTTNEWLGADEAWAKMNAQNSKWYVRIGPDEVYWDPCNQKAGFHMTFARIKADSLAWQAKLVPVEENMEQTLGALIGAPYAARAVRFHLPDFIDIVFNAGDDRTPFGATIGQSLPNWGPVSAEGRGRTVAMSNLYQDLDSLGIRRKQAESLLSQGSMKAYADSATPGLLATILHEATHNLGPAHEYKFGGKTDALAFGGQLSTMLEELKAQTGALYYIDFVRAKGIVSTEVARETYANCIVWAFGHISRGMYTAEHKRRPYSQLAAIQIGFLMDEGVVVFDPDAQAANGTDKGAFTIQYDKFPAAAEKLMKIVGRIKAQNDKAGAETLIRKYVDGSVVPQTLITERELRFPRQSFVYSIEM